MLILLNFELGRLEASPLAIRVLGKYHEMSAIWLIDSGAIYVKKQGITSSLHRRSVGPLREAVGGT